MKPRPRHVVEYAALRLAVLPLQVLPYRGALALAWSLAWLAHYAAGFRRAAARRRMREVLGAGCSETRIRRLAWLAWRNFVFSLVDVVRLPRVNRRWLERHVTGWEAVSAAVHAARARGRGAILATPHSGAWALGGVAMQLDGAPIFFFAARQRNPLTDAYWHRLLSATGVTTLKRDETNALHIVRRLREGEVLAILPDVRVRTQAMRVQFLGGAAAVPYGTAMLAMLAGVPIIPGFMRRVGWTRHEVVPGTPLRHVAAAARKAESTRLLQSLFDQFDAEIRRHPEQWFWYNSRWILEPVKPAASPAPPRR